MTGRICEKHGEHSATGVCRWCEPATPERHISQMIGMEAMQEWERILGPPPTLFDWPVITPAMNAEEERWRLVQHAALRWERVARKWNYKHRELDGPDEDGRAYIWRAWLSQVDRIYRASLHEEPP